MKLSSISLIAAALAAIAGRVIAAPIFPHPHAPDLRADCKHAAASMTKAEIANRHTKEAAYSVAENNPCSGTPEEWKKIGDKHRAEEEMFAKKREKYQNASQSENEAARVHHEIKADKEAAKLSHQSTRETMQHVTNEDHIASRDRMILKLDKKL